VISEGNRAAVFGWFELKATSGRFAKIGFSVNVETRDGLIVKYHFLENTFDVASAFRTAGDWTIETDGSSKAVPALTVERFAASEPGAWSNAYVLAGGSDAILFDAVMLRSDAEKLADLIVRSGKTLKTIFISHAHPDHFMALETLVDRFPNARVLATPDVVADVKTDGQWMLPLLQSKLGPAGPTRVVVPEPFTGDTLEIDGIRIEIREFGQGECKHLTTLYVPELRAFFAADLLYNRAHLYLQEKHLEDWLTRLDELEAFARDRVSIIYPGHGSPGGLELIDGTRAYLRTFAEALKLGDAKAVEAELLAAYPDHHVKQFLTVFTLPAYFPPASPAKA
jgi:glyoxylase-like metal-dependent hydrolase (beta-lactamase superfamily II)